MALLKISYTPTGRLLHLFGIKIKLKDFYFQFDKQRAPTIHFIHVCEPRNPGDMLSYPYLYFKSYFKHFNCMIHTTKDIKFESIKANDVVILASGGCFECLDSFQDSINRLLDMCDNVISWGCGHNAHQGRPVYWGIDFDKFRLLSVRDWQFPGQKYVPCVSCMLDLLDNKYDIKRKIGIVEHQDFPIDLEGEKINHKVGINAIIDFIGSSEIIITNTYHCAYWAMCMDKKVILYKPFSTKFNHFKHPPVVYSGDLEKDIQEAQIYPGFLQECREINLSFFASVKRIISKVRKGK